MQYSYWDGNQWQSFIPVSGSNNLTATDNDIILWADLNSIPVSWQRTTVNTHHLFWLKIEAVSDYTTGPVADEVSAASPLQRIILRR